MKLPTSLLGQVAESYITAYIQNAIFTEEYEQLEQFSSVDWYEKNFDLEKSRHIHTLSILSIVMDTIQYPKIEEPRKIYVIHVNPSEYETVQVEGKVKRLLVRKGGLTGWREIGCHKGYYAHWDKEIVKEVQQKLKIEKWYFGPINGELNKQTLIGFQFYNALVLNNNSNSQYCSTYPNQMVDSSSIFNFLGLDKHASVFSNVLAVKKALLVKGYEPGELNHRLDDKTKAALTKFQADQGLASGALDLSTLRKLGLKGF